MMPNRNLANALAAAGTLLASVVCPAFDGLTQEARVLSADLAVNFKCVNEPRAVLESGMEAFLKNDGFRVLNRGRIQRDYGVNLQSTAIIGLDDDRRIIQFVGFLVSAAGKDVLYTVGLTSPPPTRRSPELEDAILKFLPEKLGCSVTLATRGENGADATNFFNREFARIDNLFREGSTLQKPQ
jgi:hypothetical protein